MPMGLKLKESGRVVPGALDSHETEPSPDVRPHPLLLSNKVQARLGFTKSARSGKVTLDDFEGQSLEVARDKGSGLIMIRIDHLFSEQYRDIPQLRDLLIEQPETACPLGISSEEDQEAEEREYNSIGKSSDDIWLNEFLKRNYNGI